MKTLVRSRWKIKLLYVLALLVLLAEVRFHGIQSSLDRAAIWRVRTLAQNKTLEYETSWLGIEMLQYPNDLFTYAELVYAVKPDVIIETGTYAGGLTTFLAMVLEKAHPQGTIVTIDIFSNGWDRLIRSGKLPGDLLERITFIQGDSGSKEVRDRVAAHTKGKTAMVILDSLHTKDHVAKELGLYSELVSPGSYIIVNDTREESMSLIDKHAGPLAAVKEFLNGNPDFQVDAAYPKGYISCAPMGFLKRVRETTPKPISQMPGEASVENAERLSYVQAVPLGI